MKSILFSIAMLFAISSFGQTISFVQTTGDTVLYSVYNIFYIAKRSTGSILVSRTGSQSIRGSESITTLLGRAGSDFTFFVDRSLDSILLNTSLIYSIAKRADGKAVIVTQNRIRTFVSEDDFDDVASRLANSLSGANPNSTLGNILYVSGDAVANTAQKGNPLKPYTTLALAKAAAEDGDMIYVYPGTYAATNLFLADGKLEVYFDNAKITGGVICNATDTGTLIIRGSLSLDSVASRAIPIIVNHSQAVVDISLSDAKVGTLAQVYKSKRTSFDIQNLWSSSTHGVYNTATKSILALTNSASAKGEISLKVKNLIIPSWSATEVAIIGLDTVAYLGDVNVTIENGTWDRIAHTKGALINSSSDAVTVSNGSKYVFNLGTLTVDNARDSSDLTSGLVALNGTYDSTTVHVNCDACDLNYFAVMGASTGKAASAKGVKVSIEGNYTVKNNVGFWVIDGTTTTGGKNGRYTFNGVLDARDTSAIIAKTDAVDMDYVFSGLIRSEGDDPVFNSSVAVGANGLIIFKDVYLENNGTPAALASSTAITVRTAGAYQLGTNTDADVTTTALDTY